MNSSSAALSRSIWGDDYHTVLKMSSVPPNVYSSTAQELQTFSDQTEEEKLYHEAVQLVLSKPENKDAGPQEKDLLMTHCTFEELMEALKKKREQSQTFRTKHSGMLWGSSKVVVDTIKRFEKAITSMAQASLLPPFHIDKD